MVSSVQKLRSRVWLTLSISLTLLLVTGLAITYLLIRQHTQNNIYQIVYTSLSVNDLYAHEHTVELHSNIIYSDLNLSVEQIEELLPKLDLTSGTSYLVTSNGKWFYATEIENELGVLLIDITSIMLHQHQRLMELLIGGLVGFLIFIGGSLLLANSLVKPTKMTVEMQKEMTLLKKRFTANVSHELRTPLTMIKGGCDEVLAHRSETIEDQLKWFEMIGTGIDRIDILTNKLSVLADLEDESLTLTQELVDVSQCVRELVQPWEQIASERGLKFEVILEPNLLIQTNSERLEQLLEIFLNNAFEYVNDKGYIKIEVLAINQKAQILVTNSGVGIPPEDLAKIFEYFHRSGTSSIKTSGSGLGLPIAKKIVDQLGGKVFVQSVANESTQVKFTF